LAGLDLSGVLARFEGEQTVETGELVTAEELLHRVGPVPGLARILSRLGAEEGVDDPAQAAAALEFTFEGLHLSRRLDKEELPGRTVYG
jgi:magnesium chelatase subunit I